MKFTKIIGLKSTTVNDGCPSFKPNCKLFYFTRLIAILMFVSSILIYTTGCSEQADYEIVSQQSHFPVRNKIVIRHIVQSPDQRFIATAGEDNGVRIWNSGAHTLVRAFNENNSPIQAISFFNNTKIIIVTRKATLRVYDIRSGQLVAKPLHFNIQAKKSNMRPSHIKGRFLRRKYFDIDPLKVKFSRTGRFVAIYTPKYLKVVDLTKMKVIKEFDKNKVQIRLFDFTWSGENMVYATRLRRLEYFSFKTMSVYKQSKKIAFLRHQKIRDIALIYNNTHLIATGWGRRQLKIWNLVKQTTSRSRYNRYKRSNYYQYRRLTRFFRPGNMYVDKFNNIVVLYRKSGEVMMLDFKKHKKITELNFKGTVLHSVVTTRNGKNLLLASEQTPSGGHPYLVAAIRTKKIGFSQTNSMTHATAFLVKDKFLYTAHFNGSIHQWQLDTGLHIASFKVGIQDIKRLHFLKNKNSIVGMAAGGKIFAYNFSKNKLTQLIYLNSTNPDSIGLDLDAERFLTGYGKYCIKLWSLKYWLRQPNDKSSCPGLAKRNVNSVQNIIYNNVNKSTIISYDDVHFRVYSNSGSLVSTYLVREKIRHLRLNGDGKTLAVIMKPNHLVIWKVPIFSMVLNIKLPPEFGDISSIEYSHDNRLLYIGSASGVLIKYDSYTGKEIYRQKNNNSPVSILSETSMGNLVITGHLDNSIRVRNSINGKLKYVIEVLPENQWIIYRPGSLPLVASKNANKYFRLRDKKTGYFPKSLLNRKETYTDQLPSLKPDFVKDNAL